MKILFFCVLCCLLICVPSRGDEAMHLRPLHATYHVWQMSEFTLSGKTEASVNPYDPDDIAVDVSFTGPSGRVITLPAFWHQPFVRRLEKRGGAESEAESEVLQPQGAPGWRVRWTPLEAGPHQVRLAVTRRGQRTAASRTTLTVAAKSAGARGFVHVEPKDKRYFQTSDGQPLPLLGENTAWHGQRGTYDYDAWFGAMSRHRMNYSRLWMWHNSFGVEFWPAERLHYNQERAWQLDYVLDLAAQKRIVAMLCLDYHGIFEEKPDMWGGNNFWLRHAYNRVNGGPCATQNDFFTDAAAKALYRKRLRYLIGRYGAFTSLMSWQFFNEINNVYGYLKPADVVAWHGEMSRWLKAHDPYRHLVTTSFGSAGEQPEMWRLPGLDYAQWHWYGNWGGPYQHAAAMAGDVAHRFRRDYNKPVYIGEFGTHGGGPKEAAASDPHRRGLRQALWAGIFSGSAGTAMPWWWEHNHDENLYPLWNSLAQFLDGTNFGRAGWKPLRATAPQPGKELGRRAPGGQPFSATIKLNDAWGAKTAGTLVLRRAGDGDLAALNGFIHGSQKRDLQTPFRIISWLGDNARLVLHLNSVANEAAVAVRHNGREIFRRALPNKDGGWERNNEYNEDIAVPLPAGRAEIEVLNPGGDWAYFDWVRLENALPAQTGGASAPPLDVLALSDAGNQTILVWALDPNFNWPRGAKAPAETIRGGVLTLHGLADGRYQAQWRDTRTGRPLGTTLSRSQGSAMKLQVTNFQVDVAARLRRLK